jgi:hypothetical protein
MAVVWKKKFGISSAMRFRNTVGLLPGWALELRYGLQKRRILSSFQNCGVKLPIGEIQ